VFLKQIGRMFFQGSAIQTLAYRIQVWMRCPLIANHSHMYGSGNEFILPVLPVHEPKQQFWERYKLKLTSCNRA